MPAKQPDTEEWMPPAAFPPKHLPPRPKTPEEQKAEHEAENPSRAAAKESDRGTWTGRDDWTRRRRTAPIGSRDDLIEGIYSAVADRIKMEHPDAASIQSGWLNAILDAFEFGSLDQDVRHVIKERLKSDGVGIS